jgi:septal ring factor EnvC (AmiA/AmiB activator)
LDDEEGRLTAQQEENKNQLQTLQERLFAEEESLKQLKANPRYAHFGLASPRH